MKKELLNKYSIPVPRYTSYPPANFFDETFSAETYRTVVIESNELQPQHISVYIHIPFCVQMCFYCGCNAILNRNKETKERYIEALKKEMSMVLPLIDHNRKISQIHYGGGSPTSQPVAVLKEINDLILSEFDCIENPEIAIECHPGYLDLQYYTDLINAGFNRISLGIQDFNKEVLRISNRKEACIPVEDIVKALKDRSIPVNMDFIYGLPLQTPESFAESMDRVIAIRPDRVVTFSYAHVPWVNKLQQQLEKAGLPSTSEKNDIYETAKRKLTDAGYKMIGLDHFVLPTDELYEAQQTKALHRNFQGYCTRRTTGQVYAFGTTGISQLATAYSQNTKKLEDYIRQVEDGKLPITKGYVLNAEEQITRSVISALMCNYMIIWSDLSDQLNLSIATIKAAMNYDIAVLEDFQKDGIIEFDENHITILDGATPFVRNVAASLDKLMLNTDKQFSKSI